MFRISHGQSDRKEKTYGGPLADMLSIVILQGLEDNFFAVVLFVSFHSRRGTRVTLPAQSRVLIYRSVSEIRKGKAGEQEAYKYNYRHAPNIFASRKSSLLKLGFESSVMVSRFE